MPTTVPTCPQCGLTMQVQFRNSDGAAFWGCPAFTSRGCRATGDIKCERCQSHMVKRLGEHGEFLGCARFPTCRWTRPFPADPGNSLEHIRGGPDRPGKPSQGGSSSPLGQAVPTAAPIAIPIPVARTVAPATAAPSPTGRTSNRGLVLGVVAVVIVVMIAGIGIAFAIAGRSRGATTSSSPDSDKQTGKKPEGQDPETGAAGGSAVIASRDASKHYGQEVTVEMRVRGTKRLTQPNLLLLNSDCPFRDPTMVMLPDRAGAV
jgi:topoisomerase-like DNA binding C4 zinc finger protein